MTAADGAVVGAGTLPLFAVRDPHGARHEIAWVNPGVSAERGLPWAEWTTVDLS